MTAPLYNLSLTKEQLVHLLYVCEDVAEVYAERNDDLEDAVEQEFVYSVSVTLEELKGRIRRIIL